MKLGQRAWQLLPPDSSTIDTLIEEVGVSPLLGRIMSCRGLTDPEGAKRFLGPTLSSLPSPGAMADLDLATTRLAAALKAGERIAVFGDYDADGITATALAVWGLRSLGADVRPWLANRFGWGYGLSPATIDEILEDTRSLALIVDCGTSDIEALETAKKCGLDVVIVDHHPPGKTLPEVNALVNPQRRDCGFEDKGMASVGLVFYLMGALRTKLGVDLDVRRALDLVAIGTVADVAPMTRVNRTLVRKGLEVLGTHPSPGLAALQLVAGATGAPSSETIAFKLGPRINAAGRLGNPMLALELLLEEDHSKARELAGRLDELSRERREIQKEIIDAALPVAQEQATAGTPALLVGGDGWHQGVIGIAAARLCDEFDRPAGVVGFKKGVGRGSIRAPKGYNLNHALHECSSHLVKFGGHAGAAGFTVTSDEMEAFTKSFCTAIEKQASERIADQPLQLEAEASSEDFTLRRIAELELLGPFGNTNPEPTLLFQGARIIRADERMGGHMSAIFDCAGPHVKSFGPHMASAWPSGVSKLDLAFGLRRNSYRGLDQVEMRLIDVKPSDLPSNFDRS